MSSSHNRIIAKHEKRISLRCPCSISLSTLEKSRADDSYSIKLTLENEGDGSIANDTVKTAAIVIRCTDENGNNVRFDGNDYLVKTVNFGEDGLERSQEITMAVMLGSFDGVLITDFEVYVSRIKFADATVLDYLRADFFPVPAKPVPLSKKLSEEDIIDAKVTFGESAECMPEKLSEVVWRCTCGEICEANTCPMCGCERDAVFSYFGVTSLYVPKGDYAPTVKGKKSTANVKGIIIGVLSAIAAILLIVLLLAILSKCTGNAGKNPDEGGQNSTTTTDPSNNNIPESSAEALANAYAASHNYDQALEVCKANNLSNEFTSSIKEQAVTYYASLSDYVKAYTYASTIDGYEALAVITEGAYNQCLTAKNYAEAIKYADLLSDPAKKKAAVVSMTDDLMASGDYLAAFNAAKDNGEEELAATICETGIETLRNANSFDNAIALAEASEQTELVSEINAEAASYYIDAGDFNSAAKYAAASGDTEVMRELCSKLDDQTLRLNLPYYFEYLSADRIRTILGSRISGGRLASLITPDGKVLYGMGESYSPEAGLSALSVSSGLGHTAILLSNGEVVVLGDNSYRQHTASGVKNALAVSAGANHTAVLLEDGTVRAYGDNTYGQCNVSSFTNVVAICAGDNFTIALTKNGDVLSTDSKINTASLKNVVSISAGRVHALALNSKGEVISIGSPLLGMGATESFTDVVSISAGATFSAALKSDGTLCFTGTVINDPITEADLETLFGAVEIFSSDGYILALFEDGTLRTAGALAPDVSWINDYITSLENNEEPTE